LREDIVLRRIEDPMLRRKVFLATLCCGYASPALAPMQGLLRTIAAETCFTCEALAA
jgi:hypothetical protein